MVVRGDVRAQQASEEDLQSHQVSQVMRSLTICPETFADFLQSLYDMRADLGQTFGTKKAKKTLAAITENAIAPRTPQQGNRPQALEASEKALMASIKDVTMSVPTEKDLESAMNAGKPVPKGNFMADEIQDVYKPEVLIGKDILELIQVNDWMQAVKKNENIQVRSRFIANRLRRVGSGENAVSRLRLLRYAYLALMLLMTSRKAKERGVREILKKDKLQEELGPVPPPVIESIRRKFSDRGYMRKQHVDLLTTHLCAFACILDSFESNNFDLKEDLKIEQREMNQYFMEIGARISKRKVDEGRTDSIAVLKLPLVFPRMKQGRRG